MEDSIDRAMITGAWHLLGWRIEYSDGRAATHPFGECANGLLLYTPDGHMSAGISREEREGLGGGSARQADAAARARAFDGHFHYQGRYRIEGGTIVHSVTGALNPDFVGSEQVRRVRLVNDVLELSAEDLLPGTSVHRRHVLQWKRAG